MRRFRRLAAMAAVLAFLLVAPSCSGANHEAVEEDLLPAVEAAADEAIVPIESAPAPTTSTTTVPPSTTVAPPRATSTPTPLAPEPLVKPYGGTAVFGHSEEPETLNPFEPGGSSTAISVLGQTYWAGVQDIDGETLEFIPDVVNELPTVANGGLRVNADGTMTVLYSIHMDAVWSDGTPISGDDFQFTLDTILDPELPIQKTIYEDIIQSRAGPKSFEYTLAAPTVQYELLFNTLIPKHQVEGSDFLNDWDDQLWLSGGPFVFDEWVKGREIRMVRNDRYWRTDPESGQSLPYLDEFVLRFPPKRKDVSQLFLEGEVDVINPPPSVDEIALFNGLEPAGVVVDVASGPRWEHLNFQFGPGRFDSNPESINENLNFRKAVAHAIDRERIVEDILDGQVEPLQSFVDVFVPSMSLDAWDQYSYNPKRAKILLEAAKQETGIEDITVVFSTTSDSESRAAASELYREMLEDIGINFETELQDSQTYFQNSTINGQWDVGQWAWRAAPGISGLVGIWDIFDPEQTPPVGENRYRWGSNESAVRDEATARFAELRDLINATVDERELIPLMNEAEELLADQVVIIPLYPQLNVGAVWANRIGGYVHNPTSATDAWNVESWYRADL